MKPEAPHLRRFFFAGKRVVMVADDLPAAPDLPRPLTAAWGFVFCCRRNPAYCMYKYKKKGKELMKIIQQDEKVIACIGKDETNERKIMNMKMIESIQENGVTDYEVDAENPRLYSEGGLLYYGKKKTMPNGKARLMLVAVPPDKKGTVEIAPGTEMIAGDAFTNSKASKVILPKTVTAIVPYAFNRQSFLMHLINAKI